MTVAGSHEGSLPTASVHPYLLVSAAPLCLGEIRNTDIADFSFFLLEGKCEHFRVGALWEGTKVKTQDCSPKLIVLK